MGYFVELKEIVEGYLVPLGEFLVAGEQKGYGAFVDAGVVAQMLVLELETFHAPLDPFGGDAVDVFAVEIDGRDGELPVVGDFALEHLADTFRELFFGERAVADQVFLLGTDDEPAFGIGYNLDGDVCVALILPCELLEPLFTLGSERELI